MKPERWQQLDQLFHSALEQAPDQRAAFLDKVCAGDEWLRRQVEALLGAHEKAGSFIQKPALEVEARSLAYVQPDSVVGQTLGHYKIITSIGAGGMGEVYLAQDIQLGRKVALKLLPAEFTQDSDRVRRFQQEARAASALNHPNIITIHDIGQAEGRHFIATEYIEGETLRQTINVSKSLQLGEVLSIVLQVADALAAAHAKGIVHRDIKPENIILVRDSHLQQKERFVKVLDFGIAKLTEQEAGTEGEATTRVLLNTHEGSVIGTASYMSPEQARGEKVDARSDLWSLGTVLYEMLTKEAPFGGDTAQDVIASILKEEPPEISADVPDRLKWIVEKALRKDKEERYQTAREMFSDLRMLQKLENERSVPTGVTDDRSTRGNTIQVQAKIVGDTAGNSFLNAVRRHTGLVGILLVISIIAALGTVFGLRKLIRINLMPSSSFQDMSMTELTSSGKVIDAAISPDGKFVVQVVADGEQQRLWMKQVSSPASEVPINEAAKTTYTGLTFSKSGDDLFYTACENKLPCSLYRMPGLGGAPRKLVTDVDSSVSFSPDGKQFAYLRGIPPQGEVTLLIANADGTGEREIVRRNMGGDVPAFVCSWSPDGKVIIYPLNSSDESGNSVTLVGVQVADGSEKPISSRRWAKVDHLAWVNDGSGLVLTGRENHGSPSQVWFLSYPGGQVHKITNDLKDYVSVSLTADSATLVTVDSEQVSNIWIAPYDNARDASQITGNKFDGVEGVTWTPDGRVIYASRTGNGKLDLWKVDANGKEQKRLTADEGNNWSPSVSADGRYVTFVSDRTGSDHIWRIDVDGSNARQLTYGVGELNPQCSPNSDWVFYNLSTGKNDVWKVSIQGGEPVHIVDKASGVVAISPNGKWIAAPYHDPTPKWKTGIYPIEGGEPNKILDISTGVLSWTPDGRALVYLDNVDVQNLNIQPIDGSPPKRLTNFTDSRLFSFAISADGKRIAVARGTLTHDVVLIKDFRGQQ